jgi:hypothetical protein
MGIINGLGHAFRNLFEAESDRKLRQQTSIARTEAQLEETRRKSEAHMRRYREKAIEALRIGSKANYQTFRRDLKRTMAFTHRITELQLSFQGAVQRVEEVGTIQGFCTGMTAVSHSLRDALKGVDLTEAMKDMASVTSKTKGIEQSVDQFLRVAGQMSMSDETFANEDQITDAELDEMLRREAVLGEKSEGVKGMDAEIAKEMEAIEKLQKELGAN